MSGAEDYFRIHRWENESELWKGNGVTYISLKNMKSNFMGQCFLLSHHIFNVSLFEDKSGFVTIWVVGYFGVLAINPIDNNSRMSFVSQIQFNSDCISHSKRSYKLQIFV